MNWKNRLTNYNFWISIFSAALLILQALKIEFDIAYVNEIFTAILGLLVVIGIVSDPTRVTVKATEIETKSKQETQKLVEENSDVVKIEETNIDEQKTASLPIGEKDETDYNNFQTDIKNVLTQISKDIKQQIKEMSETKMLNNTENSVIENINETLKTENLQQEETPAPAAAEMDNPYLM